MTTKKICILGSSYIGAVYSAYKAAGPANGAYDLDFYGHSNGGFPNVEILNGHIRNVRFKSASNSLAVSAYDAFVIYADLPSPHDLAKVTRACAGAGYSQQVTEAVVSDTLAGKSAVRLYQTLKTLTGKPVFLISANVVLISQAKMNDERYAYNLGLIEKALGAGVYLPFPRSLFDAVYLPVGDFYKGSITLTGDEAGDHDPGHDNHHMNEAGGRKILEAIFERLERTIGDTTLEAA